jgi:dCMP deaminase
MNNYRPDKDKYYWEIAKEVASRSTCMSAKGGAVIVKDDQIISTGYIGAPRGVKDCFERGTCVRRLMGIPSGQRYEICRSVHAEQNAIINSARSGTSLLGAKLYLYFVKRSAEQGDKFVLAYPCFICKKLIINSGITEFIGNDEKGNLVNYNVSDWVNDWKEKDLFDDKVKYEVDYKSNQ